MLDIAKFAKKPELIKIELDAPEVVEKYEGTVTFYVLDSIDIATYFEFYKSQADNDGKRLNDILRKLILNAEGKQVIEEGHMLPVDLALASLSKIGEQLGKSGTK
jgi:hypothetical protein